MMYVYKHSTYSGMYQQNENNSHMFKSNYELSRLQRTFVTLGTTHEYATQCSFSRVFYALTRMTIVLVLQMWLGDQSPVHQTTINVSYSCYVLLYLLRCLSVSKLPAKHFWYALAR